MFKNLFWKSCLTVLIMLNTYSIQSMGLKDIVTSQPAKIFCTTTALLGGSLLCPIIAKCEMKRIRLESSHKTYTQILRKKAPSLLLRFFKESLPIGLATAGYSYFDPSGKITVASLITSGITAALLSMFIYENTYQKTACDYPGGLETHVRVVGHLINFPDRLHKGLYSNLIFCSGYYVFSKLKNRIISHLLAQ